MESPAWARTGLNLRLLAERPHELWALGGHSVAQLGGERRVQEELDALHGGWKPRAAGILFSERSDAPDGRGHHEAGQRVTSPGELGEHQLDHAADPRAGAAATS